MSETSFLGIVAGGTQQVEFGIQRDRLYVDIARLLLLGVRYSQKAPSLTMLTKDHVITSSRRGRLFTRLYFNTVLPEGAKDTPLLETRMRGLAHLLTAINGETAGEPGRRDPLLEAALGGQKAGFGMKARLVLPEHALNWRPQIATYAQAHRQRIGLQMGYQAGGPTKVELGGDVRSATVPWGVWIDANPARGLYETGRQVRSDGSVAVALEGVNLASHTQQILCMTGLIAAAHAIRNPEEVVATSPAV